MARYAFEPVWNVRQGVVSAFRTVRLAAAGDTAAMAEAEHTAPGLRDIVTLRHAMSEWTKLPGTGLGLPVTGLSIANVTRDGAMRICVQVGPTDLCLDFPVEAARRIGYALLTASASGRPT